jgi:hypothetical protein
MPPCGCDHIEDTFAKELGRSELVESATNAAQHSHDHRTVYNRLMITAVRSSCCLVPLENLMTAS